MTGKTVGFIGLGNMGLPMAQQILKAGFKLTVLDIDPQAVSSFREAAVIAASPREVADNIQRFVNLERELLPRVAQVENEFQVLPT